MRRAIPRLFLAAFFALLVLGADFAVVPHDGTVADPDLVYNTATVAVVFDDAYTAAGVTIARVDVNVLSATGTAVTTWTRLDGWTIADGLIRVPVRTEATALANGTYQIQCRVWDTFGNVSTFSDPYFVTKQWKTLPSPGGCRTLP